MPNTFADMDPSKNSWVGTSIVFLLLFTGALYIFVWSPSSGSNPLFGYQGISHCQHYPNSTTEKVPDAVNNYDELDLVLLEASMPNKTVIIAVANKAYVDQSVDAESTMLDLFLESFWLGEDTRPLLDHLVLVTVDQTAYDRCKFKRLHCYRLVTAGVDFGGEEVYMSEDFIKMMWSRTGFLLDVLKRGYNFIFTVRIFSILLD
ncbi:Nucleotide-diphospho-sugar transferase [Corchorus olitorius]|uniref:Nucleotide-diphospho-sugar transferase n=1 Tax=Corchorus olitorius TaxID=93759 RepID=A0A1R3K129_9ROSI|nr:Nucleotide-diphospho-sugar transferase [Corchorus olitorius]